MSDLLEAPIKMKMQMEIPESLYQLFDILSGAGHEAYIAGGAVRDSILGKSPKDYDISTSASPQVVVDTLSPHVKFSDIQGEKSFAVARVIAFDGNEYEFAPYRSDEGTRRGGSATFVSSIKEDVLRRDLTINALFYRVPSRSERIAGETGEVVDYVGGIKDINEEVIRTVGSPEKRFEEDRLRILRAFRFAGRVDGGLDKETSDAIMKNNSLTTPSDAAVSEERIKEEVIKGVASAKIPSNYLNMLLDYGVLGQIIPGLKISRAFSSSKDIKIQFASILRTNDPSEVGKVLSARKFGNNIRDVVKFLISLNDIRKDNVVPLKKEYMRLKKSSSDINDDTLILEYGAIIGKNLNRFVEFANSPPALSAKDLISSGVKPGPELGRAIHDAEVEAYFHENFNDEDGQFITRGPVNDKLAKLAIILKKLSAEKEAEQIKGIIIKTSNPDIFIPELSGDVYVFDMDDTLFWSPEWHNIIEYNSNGEVSSAEEHVPNYINNVMSFINGVNSNPLNYFRENLRVEAEKSLEQFQSEVGRLSLERTVLDIPMLGKKDQVLLVLKNAYGDNVLPELFNKYFSGKHKKRFDLRGLYLDNAVVVAGDPRFYQSPKTLGHIPNQEIFDLYKAHSDNAVILTARESQPGMSDGIKKRISDAGGSSPVYVFTKPKGIASGSYKGQVLGEIALQGGVTSIAFYDDNLKYINSVKNVLNEDYPEVSKKITVHRVSTDNKPLDHLLKME